MNMKAIFDYFKTLMTIFCQIKRNDFIKHSAIHIVLSGKKGGAKLCHDDYTWTIYDEYYENINKIYNSSYL